MSFLDDHSSCADAIVSPPIPFINSDFLVNSTAFAFICYYICAIKLVVHYITNPGFKLHPKKEFWHLVQMQSQREQELEGELEEKEEEMRELRERLEKLYEAELEKTWPKRSRLN